MPTYQEGGKCPECGGTLFYPPVENCSCHLSAPCSACTNNSLLCHDCDFEDVVRVHRPSPHVRTHPKFAPAEVTGRAPETEVIYGEPTFCCGQHYTYEALSRFYSAQYGFPFIVYSMDDFGNLYTSGRIDLYVINVKRIAHSSCSMLVTGRYPPHMSMDEVRKEVNGTFGGHFETFGNGQFSFIAYTD